MDSGKLRVLIAREKLSKKEIAAVVSKQNKEKMHPNHVSNIALDTFHTTTQTVLKICRAISQMLTEKRGKITIITPNDIIDYEHLINPKLNEAAANNQDNNN